MSWSVELKTSSYATMYWFFVVDQPTAGLIESLPPENVTIVNFTPTGSGLNGASVLILMRCPIMLYWLPLFSCQTTRYSPFEPPRHTRGRRESLPAWSSVCTE